MHLVQKILDKLNNFCILAINRFSMKFWKHTLISAFAFFGIASTVLYSACSDDNSGCSKIICRNGGTCSGGSCRCPSGYEGPYCEIGTNEKFLGKFMGNTSCNTTPEVVDSVMVQQTDKPGGLMLYKYSNPDQKLYGEASTSSSVSISGDGVNGSAMIENGHLSVTITETGSNKVCTFAGTRVAANQ